MAEDRATIVALASGAGRAGVAVLRLSGPEAWQALAALLRGRLPEPRLASLRALYDPKSGALLDEALILVFEEGRSFTGEAVAEIHCHGSPLIVQDLLDCLEALPGVRPAKAGEFTRRALMNGKLSVLEVEALGALLEAETPWHRELGKRSRVMAQEAMVRGWRAQMIAILADVEASIDFADEDLPELEAQPWLQSVRELCAELGASVGASHWLERHRRGLLCVIAGPANVGKSSLINNLVGRSVALVHDSEGTTRDAIEAHMEVAGIPVTLVDTAGLRSESGAVEAMGIARAKSLWEEADVRVSLHRPGGTALPGADLVVQSFSAGSGLGTEAASDVLWIDNACGVGLDTLRRRLEIKVRALVSEQGLGQALTSERQNRLASACLAALEAIEASTAIELQALHLTRGINALSLLLGDYDVEEMLDALFANFCIGK